MSTKNGPSTNGTTTTSQRAILLWLLVATYCCYNIFIEPISEVDTFGPFYVVALWGATTAIPPLLALWTVMSPASLGMRLSTGLCVFMLAMASVGVDGFTNGIDSEYGALVDAIAFGIQFAAFCAFLAVMRHIFRWQLALPPSTDVRILNDGQFGLWSLLVWPLEIGVAIAAMQYLSHRLDSLSRSDVVSNSMILARNVFVFQISMMPWVWVVLARGRSRMIAGLAFVVTAVGLAIYDYRMFENAGPDILRIMAATASQALGLIVGGSVALVVFRICGYRLARALKTNLLSDEVRAGPAPDSKTELSAGDTASAASTQFLGRRFAIGLFFQLVLLAAIVWIAIQILPLRRQLARNVRWIEFGWGIGIDDDGTKVLSVEIPGTIGDREIQALEEADFVPVIKLDPDREDSSRLAALSKFKRIGKLDLNGTETSDNDLRLIALIDALETIDLSKTEITGATLSDLERLPKLKQINLARTKVTDNALAGLEQLKGLVWIDLTGTGVTLDGIARLQRALPHAKIIGPY
jgi:hypothetical protein